jgi:hypothetical protein
MIYEFIAGRNSALVGFAIRQLPSNLMKDITSMKVSQQYEAFETKNFSFDSFYWIIGFVQRSVETRWKPHNRTSGLKFTTSIFPTYSSP